MRTLSYLSPSPFPGPLLSTSLVSARLSCVHCTNICALNTKLHQGSGSYFNKRSVSVSTVANIETTCSHVTSWSITTNPLHQVPSPNPQSTVCTYITAPTYSPYLSSASFWLLSATCRIGVMGKSLARPENSPINSIPVQQYLPCTVIFKTC